MCSWIEPSLILLIDTAHYCTVWLFCLDARPFNDVKVKFDYCESAFGMLTCDDNLGIGKLPLYLLLFIF